MTMGSRRSSSSSSSSSKQVTGAAMGANARASGSQEGRCGQEEVEVVLVREVAHGCGCKMLTAI